MPSDRSRGLSSPTVAEVAAEAGVGKATAARTLGNYGSVSPAARARVLAAAEKLRYRPNNLARSMTTGITQTVGVIVADISNPFFAGVMRGIADACDTTDYTAIVLSTDEKLAEEQSAIGVLMDKQVDAIIIASAAVLPHESAHILEAMSRKIPIVLIDRKVRGLDLDAVVINNRESARDAARRFIDLGHRRIAFAWGPAARDRASDRRRLLALADNRLWSEAERLRGYLDALDEAGIPFDPSLVTHCAHNEEVTVGAMAEMLSLDSPPTAILTTETDAMVGTLRAVRAAGLSYPRDVSLIGFDDSSWASVMEPPLTMIAQPMLQLGRDAAKRAFARIAGDDQDAVVETIPTAFVSRASVTSPADRARVSDADVR
ncbi:LacI family DNA-binding transcriptional regulator [Humibacter sp.]|uniref:LacI family DNA-binding transcriptional regulator n=1 Tax=Humibacter sp. TaxID=1940291 RepID=UPI003F7E7758